MLDENNLVRNNRSRVFIKNNIFTVASMGINKNLNLHKKHSVNIKYIDSLIFLKFVENVTDYMKIKINNEFYLRKYEEDHLKDSKSYIFPNTGKLLQPKWTLTSRKKTIGKTMKGLLNQQH